jgi:hypothetical protein
MSSLIKGLMVVGMVAGALVVTGTVAAADPIENEGNDQYRHAMDYFVPELGRWATELAQTVEALPVKPDLAEDLPELAYRGMLMKFDLEGTQAPDEMTDAHEKLVFAMGQLTEVAQIAVDDPAGADLLMGQYMSLLDDARHEVRAWLTADVQVVDLGQTPVLLVAGK